MRGLPLTLCGLSAELAADTLAPRIDGIDLARHDADSLQRLVDALATRPCPRPTNASCGWRVLSVSARSAPSAPPVPSAAAVRRSAAPVPVPDSSVSSGQNTSTAASPSPRGRSKC